ncbi:crossover junction endonuclease MUS81 [Clonorchis sinensis]|uniref:Crossover junction endonuclease MUS81 n=1 Tax=Clonorchis sinensis TaxID=79923 RepID=H2KR00_CLOSI|nr:crossover junction endonuclease MUS81 [Clonorchis sinensis]
MLRSGKECRILEGFGPRLCDFLDDKLSSYAEELGMSPADALYYGNKEFSRSPSKAVKVTVAQVTMSNQHIVSTDTSPCTSQVRQFEDTSAALTAAEQQLVDLFRSSNNPMGCSLQELASCLRSPGQNYNVTPIRTLVDRLLSVGLISPVNNCPGRYIIRNRTPAVSDVNTECSTDPHLNTTLTLNSGNSVSTDGNLPAITDYPLKFRYANEAGDPVNLRLYAHRKTFVPDDGAEEKLVGYRILCSYEELLLAGIHYRLDWNAPSLEATDRQLTFAYLLDPDAPCQSTLVVPSSEESLLPPAKTVPLVTVTTSGNGSSSTFSKRSASPVSSSVPVKVVLRKSISATCAPLPSSLGLSNSQSALIASTNVRSQPNSPTRTQSAMLSRFVTSETSSDVVVPGGSYDLVLLTDVREQFGLNRVKQLLPPVLRSLGVECESRALPVGDFIWIARWHTESGRPMEAVLDYVIERKRADDLASSMVDGRFQEQKYRMKRTQIAHTIFLIEECSSMRNQRIPFETLLQAVSNAQVIDGFQIMTTRCPEDTVDLLAALTNVIRNDCIHDLHVHSPTGSPDSIPLNSKFNSDCLRAISWVAFIQLANKSPPPTVRDVFARQLLQIHGFSGPKISAILERYPTPACLMRAYDCQATKSAKENLLTSLKVGDSNKCIGGVLSRRVYLAYNTQ